LFTTKQWAHSQRELLGTDINSVLGLLHYVYVDSVVDVLEEHTISTFRDEVRWLVSFCFETQRVKRGDKTEDWESCADSLFKGPRNV
jgi:hypothetical protein